MADQKHSGRVYSRGTMMMIASLAVLGVATSLVGVPARLLVPFRVGSIALLLVLAVVLVTRIRKESSAVTRTLTTQSDDIAVANDRLHLAQQLHDLLSDDLALIALRSTVALDQPSASSDDLRGVLTDISGISERAIADLRRLLRTLKDNAASVNPADASSIADELERIVADARQAGLTLHQNVPANLLQKLPQPSADLALLVIREGVANTARYAGPTQLQVSVAMDDGDVVVTVSDDGPVEDWCPIPGSGLGLEMLSERLTANGSGGQLSAGPSKRGFILQARIPVTPRTLVRR